MFGLVALGQTERHVLEFAVQALLADREHGFGAEHAQRADQQSHRAQLTPIQVAPEAVFGTRASAALGVGS